MSSHRCIQFISDQLEERVRELSLLVGRLTKQVTEQTEVISSLRSENQLLRDEVARLKGQKGKPAIKPSHLAKERKRLAKDTGEKAARERGGKKLKIDEIRTLKVKAPKGSRFLGYVNWDVQDLVITRRAVRYRRARWQLADGSVLLAALPAGVSGSHFGADLRRFLVYQHHHARLPQARLLEQVREFGVVISAGQIDAILQEEAQRLSDERAAMFMSGILNSPFLQVDDTGARHQGRNGYCTHIGNPCFAAFFSTQSKNRANFLNLISGGRWIFRVDQVAIERMRDGGLSQRTTATVFQLPFEKAKQNPIIFDQRKWLRYLKRRGLSEREQAIASEAALYATARTIISPDMVIVSDDAGQFHVLHHGLCWVHAERKIHQLIPGSDEHRAQQERVRNQIWQIYDALKRYKKSPKKFLADRLRLRFDHIFTQITGYQKLDEALKRIHANRSELLLVLDRPEIPLHNNESERDLREYVIRRKISSGTRSAPGREARDIMISLMKTCRKLGVSFYAYLGDRIKKTNFIPPLADLVAKACAKLTPARC
jgi:hypothetical protein